MIQGIWNHNIGNDLGPYINWFNAYRIEFRVRGLGFEVQGLGFSA